MRWADALRPRDPALAGRALAGFTGTAAVAQFLYTLLTPASGVRPGALMSYGLPLVLALIAAGVSAFPRRVPVGTWIVVPLLGLAAITVLDVASHDTSVQAQVFLYFPVLFAASQLRRAAAWTLTALALVSELVVTFSSESSAWAAADSGYIGAGLVAAAWLLLHSAAVQDRLVDRLARLATLDPLTGLVTRRALDDQARAALAPSPDRRRGATEAGTALLVIDLDLFKTVNDTHGHPIGDDFLAHVARVLKDHCRPTDVVSRLGGDEFAVLMPRCPYSAAVQRARQLVEQARDATFRTRDGVQIPIRMSVGVGHAPATGSGDGPARLRALYTRADRALYQVKAAGRGGVG